jgi:hypothetical protein
VLSGRARIGRYGRVVTTYCPDSQNSLARVQGWLTSVPFGRDLSAVEVVAQRRRSAAMLRRPAPGSELEGVHRAPRPSSRPRCSGSEARSAVRSRPQKRRVPLSGRDRLGTPGYGRRAIDQLCQVDLGPGRSCSPRAGHTGPHVPRPQKVRSRGATRKLAEQARLDAGDCCPAEFD